MSEEVQNQIKRLYHEYRHTEDIDKKGLFFSPYCLQICRPIPSYAATSREQIVQYLKDAQKGKVPSTTEMPADGEVTAPGLKSTKTTEDKKSRSLYTIRPLSQAEFEFGNDDTDITAWIDMTVEELKSKTEAEEWVGMRVDLWDENPANDGLLVKVQYWWRLESIPSGEVFDGKQGGEGYLQCCHDIMYLGPREGTELKSGLEPQE